MPLVATRYDLEGVDDPFADRAPAGPVRSVATVLGAVLVVLVILGGPAIANWASTGPGGTGGRQLPDPARLAGGVQRTTAVVQEVEKYSRLSGFVGIVTDNDRQVVTVLWRGAAPAGLTSLAARRPGGVRVEVKKVEPNYTSQELTAGAAMLKTRALQEDLPIDSIDPSADLSGLDVAITSGADAAVPAVSAELRSLTGFPLSVHVTINPRARPLSR